jgi:hypothetical protein
MEKSLELWLSEGATGVAAITAAAISPEPEPPEPVPLRRSPAHYLWAALIARIYEVFPLLRPMCGGQMRMIAFITHSVEIRQILEHIGVAHRGRFRAALPVPSTRATAVGGR